MWNLNDHPLLLLRISGKNFRIKVNGSSYYAETAGVLRSIYLEGLSSPAALLHLTLLTAKMISLLFGG